MVFVTTVLEDGLGEAAGIRRGQIILAVNEVPVEDNRVATMMASAAVGKVSFRIDEEGAKRAGLMPSEEDALDGSEKELAMTHHLRQKCVVM